MTPDELIAFRRKWGLTQQALARELRVAPSTVHNWERSKRPPAWLRLWMIGWEWETKGVI